MEYLQRQALPDDRVPEAEAEGPKWLDSLQPAGKPRQDEGARNPSRRSVAWRFFLALVVTRLGP